MIPGQKRNCHLSSYARANPNDTLHSGRILGETGYRTMSMTLIPPMLEEMGITLFGEAWRKPIQMERLARSISFLPDDIPGPVNLALREVVN